MVDIDKRIIRARGRIATKAPGFAYMALHIKPIEDNTVPTICVDDYGTVYYNKKWMEGLRKEVVEGTICHEIFHPAFDHIKRGKGKNQARFNIACDLVINDLLISEGFELPECGLIPKDHTFEIAGKTIENIDKKDAEMIYREIPTKCGSDGYPNPSGFDGVPRKGKVGGESKDKGKKVYERGKPKPDWKKISSEAQEIQKQWERRQGKKPSGMSRLVNSALEGKIDWRTQLWKHIQREIPFDYTYSKPSKKSWSAGVYIPAQKKELLKCAVAIDTSGSIRNKELADFKHEILVIAHSFSSLKMRVLTCDARVHDDFELTNSNFKKFNDMVLHGGGGTDFRPVFDALKGDEYKLLIYLTDGWGTYPDECDDVKTIWVIVDGGKFSGKFGEVIDM